MGVEFDSLPVAMTKTKKPRIKKPINNGAFSVCLTVNGEDYKATGDNLLECVEQLKKPDLMLFKTKSVFVVTKGKKRAEKTLNIPQMRRLYGNTTTRSIFVKNIEMILNYE